MIDGNINFSSKQNRIELEQVVFREKLEDRLAQNFIHGSLVKKDEDIVLYANGISLKAQEDRVILFPRPKCPVSEEWFYIGFFKGEF
jgi:hypothetical protein